MARSCNGFISISTLARKGSMPHYHIVWQLCPVGHADGSLGDPEVWQEACACVYQYLKYYLYRDDLSDRGKYRSGAWYLACYDLHVDERFGRLLCQMSSNPSIQGDIRDYQQYTTGERIDGMFAAVGLIGQRDHQWRRAACCPPYMKRSASPRRTR